MLFRNVLCTAEITIYCKQGLLQQSSTPFNNVYRLRSSLQNTRRTIQRPNLENNPLEKLYIPSGPLHPKSLVKPLLFTLGVSTVSIAGCIIWQYENLRQHAANYMRRQSNWLYAQKNKILQQVKAEPGEFTKWWKSLKDTEKVFYPILGLNLLVFGAWRIRALQHMMVKYFCSNPSGNAVCLPMLLSTFSHYSTLHLAANMYVLYSFMPAAVTSLGKEQFMAMYLSAGVVSSFASFVYKVLLNQPGLSLGASGAIMGVLTYVCIQYPDTRLSIIFLPMYTFAAGTAIKFIITADLAGLIFGWKFFDHAAHLGGALFGLMWCKWGSEHVWGNRDKFLQYYHNLRNNSSR